VATSLLRRVERDAAVVCAVLAVGAWAIWPSRPAVAGGVVAGGLLIGFAYSAIKGVVGGGPVAGGPERPRRHIVKFFTRHVILAVAAYVMMARLRLDPIGMLVGASSLVMAVALEAARHSRSGPAASGR
jgi:ATP synthase I chain